MNRLEHRIPADVILSADVILNADVILCCDVIPSADVILSAAKDLSSSAPLPPRRASPGRNATHEISRHARTQAVGRLRLLGMALCALLTFVPASFGQTPNPVPLINQPLVPTAVAPGGPAFMLTVNGTGFVPESVVNWNGSPRPTTFANSSQLTAAIDAADIAANGAAWVTVVSPAPGGGASDVAFLEITSPTPSVDFTRWDAPVDALYAVTTADFNGDGKLDLAFSVYPSSTVSIYLGRGDGTFQDFSSYTTLAERVLSICAPDLNGDATPDLAVEGQSVDGSSFLSIFLGNGDGTFQTRVDYSTGSLGWAVTSGDFNGDGIRDLAVTANNQNIVSIFLGIGDGTFRTRVDYPSGSYTGSVATGDFNGDGKLDLAVAVQEAGTAGASVFLGNGDGSFAPRVQYPGAVGHPNYIIAADFSGDGKLDLALASDNPPSYAGTVSILIGNGDGTFQSPLNYATGTFAFTVVAADLNGDGRLDLAVTDYLSNDVAVLIGNGDGTFRARTNYPTPAYPAALVAGDFDGDGRLELAVTNLEAGAGFSILSQTPFLVDLSPSSLTFGNQIVGTTSAAQAVTLANLAGGNLSIKGITTSGPGGEYFGQSSDCGASLPPGGACTINVTFTPAVTGAISATLEVADDAPGSPHTVSLTGTGVAAAGLPAVGLSPLALAFGNRPPSTTSPPQTATLTNTGYATLSIETVAVTGANAGDFALASDSCSNANFAPNETCAIGVTFTPTALGPRLAAVTITDNAPGNPQLLSLSGTGAPNPVPLINQPLVPTAVAPGGPGLTLTVNGTGFVPESVVNWNGSPRPTTFASSSRLTAAIDAADVATFGTAWVTVFNPGSSASNVAFFEITLPTPSVNFERSADTVPGGGGPVATGDFDGDGKLDLALQEEWFNGDTWIEVLHFFLGNGDGSFRETSSLSTGSVVDLVSGDFNGDGKLDLAASTYHCYSMNCENPSVYISVLLGNGDGTFHLPISYSIANPYPLSVADFNQDGKLDFVTADYDFNTVSFWQGNGDGTFRAPVPYPAGTGVGYVTSGDFNGDGKLDLAASAYPTYAVSILLGNGDGSFQAPTQYPAGSYPYRLITADFNGDGGLDLVATDYGPGTVSIYLGNGDGSFQPHVDYSTGGAPFSVVAGDFNGDGKIDLAAADTDATTILLGNGDGTFAVPIRLGVPFYSASYLAAGDFDGNGRMDLAVSDFYQRGIVLLQPSFVQFTPPSVEFGNLIVGTSSPPQPLTLTNNLEGPLTISGIAVTGPDSADFSQSNDCPISPATLAPGGSCTMSVTFAPQTTGAKTAAVTVSDDVPGVPQQAVNLSGTGINPAVTLSAAALDFGNQAVNVPSAPQNVTLTNTGAGPLTITSIAASGDFAVTNTCGTTVAEGAQCAISVTFTPTMGGTHFGTVTINDNAANSPQTISLTGTGIPATITLSTTSLTFGDQNVGTTSPPQPVTVTNSGNVSLLITGIATTDDYGRTHDCPLSPSTLAPSASCTVNVTFTPTATGTRLGTLTLTDNASGSPQSVSLTGTGLPTTVSVLPASLDFGDQRLGTTSPPQPVTVTNTGGGPLTISGISASGNFARTHNCPISPATLVAGNSCTINVTFTPTARGTRTGTLTLNDNGAGSPHTVSLTGNGIAPNVGFSPAALNFPDQAVGVPGPPQDVALTNTGNTVLNMTGILATIPFAEATNCAATLNAGASCTISVNFTASVAGTTYGALIVSDDAPGSPHTASLTGTTAVSFADQPVGQPSAPQTVTLSNMSNAPRVISGITTTGDFAKSGACGTIQPGASCSVGVTFTPTAPGTRTGALVVADNAPGSPHAMTLTGVGIGPGVSFSANPLSFGGEILGTTSGPKTVTINNSGNQALSITSIAVSGDYAQAASTCVLPQTLAPGTGCSVDITFTPTAMGDRPGALSITDNAAGSPHTAALTGKGTDFAVATASGGSTSATVAAGGTATYRLSIAPTAYVGTVALSCTGAPPRATCAPSLNSVMLDGVNPASFTIIVKTTARAMAGPEIGTREPPQGVGDPRRARGRLRSPLQDVAGRRPALQVWLMALMLSLGLVAAWRRRGQVRDLPLQWRRPIGPSLLAAMVLLVVIWVACGGGGGGGGGNTGTPPGTYSLTVTATASGVSRTVSLTLTVN